MYKMSSQSKLQFPDFGACYSSASTGWSSTSSQTMLFLCLTITYASIWPYIHNTQRERKKKTKLQKMQGWRDWNCMFQLLLSWWFEAYAKNLVQNCKGYETTGWIETVFLWFCYHLFRTYVNKGFQAQ